VLVARAMDKCKNIAPSPVPRKLETLRRHVVAFPDTWVLVASSFCASCRPRSEFDKITRLNGLKRPSIPGLNVHS
jgi:hypothetical protein